MSARSRVLLFVISTPLAAALVVGGLLGASRPMAQLGVPHLKVFEDVVQLITHAYVEDINIDRVFDGAMRGLADGLDASSAYLTPDEVRALDANAAPPTGDVGLVLTRQFYLRIVGVRDGSPAHRAGLQTGDYVRAIDDRPTRDLSVFAGSRLLRGAAGSSVTLLVLRNNAAEPHKVELTREALAGEAVTSRRLAGGEQYVRIASFGSGTAAALRAQLPLGELETQSGLMGGKTPGVVIDLRATADGVPEDGVAAARLFVGSGTLATREARGADKVVLSAAAGDGSVTVPVILVVSNGTANAAEVFAAALAGANRARLVGEPTAGIAGAQRLVRLPEGHGLWLTHTQYLQADGSPIHGRGLRPDVPVDIVTVGFDEKPPTTDAALERAIAELKNAGAGGRTGGRGPAAAASQAPGAAPGAGRPAPPTGKPQR